VEQEDELVSCIVQSCLESDKPTLFSRQVLLRRDQLLPLRYVLALVPFPFFLGADA